MCGTIQPKMIKGAGKSVVADMYSLRARTKGVNRQLLLLHNCEC